MVNLEIKPQNVDGLAGQPGEMGERRCLWND